MATTAKKPTSTAKTASKPSALKAAKGAPASAAKGKADAAGKSAAASAAKPAAKSSAKVQPATAKAAPKAAAKTATDAKVGKGKGSKAAAAPPPVVAYVSAFAVGNRVTHTVFGDGKVLAVDGDQLTIKFSSAEKVIIDSFVKAGSKG